MNKKASTDQFLILFIFIIIVLAGAGFISGSQGALSTDAYIEIFSKDIVFITEAAIGAPSNVIINYPFNLDKFKFTFDKGWVYIKDKSQKLGANSTITTDQFVPMEIGKIENTLVFFKTYNEIILGGIANSSLNKLMCAKSLPAKRLGEIKAIIDPGHGGADKGYVNYADANMNEADRAYVLAANIKQGFYSLGLTKEKLQDKNLSERLSLINPDTDLVISVHTGNDKNQVIAYVPFDNVQSASMACHILNKLALQLPDISGIAVVPTSKMPILNKNTGKLSVMLEIGSVQEPKDTNMLYKDTYKITEAISAGIEEYFDGSS
jgi:N-acetylmuramoyl-L-alanine amidase